MLTTDAQRQWHSLAALGERRNALLQALRDPRPVFPRDLAHLLHAVAECDAHDHDRPDAAAQQAADAVVGAAMEAMPEAPLTLREAVLLCQDAEGYLTAAAQATLLEGYGGIAAATSAPALADDVRAALARPGQAVRTTPRRRRRRRRDRVTRPPASATPPTVLAAKRARALRSPSGCRLACAGRGGPSRRAAPPRPFHAGCSAVHASGSAWRLDPRTPPFAPSRWAGGGLAVPCVETFPTYAPHAVGSDQPSRNTRAR